MTQTTNAIQIDTEFETLIPPLHPEELALLEQSLLDEGCRDPLTVWGDLLIDGHNRYRICQRHGIPFDTVQHDFDSRETAILWIIRNQLGRRNLTDYERGRLALRGKEALAARAKANQAAAGGDRKSTAAKSLPPNLAEAIEPIDTRVTLAAAAGVSHGSLDAIQRVETAAPEPIKLKARRGELSIHRADVLTKAINAAMPRTRSFVVAHDVDDPELVKWLSQGEADGREWFNELTASGYIQPGEEVEAVPLASGLLALQKAVAARDKARRQIEAQVKTAVREQAALTLPTVDYFHFGDCRDIIPTLPKASIRLLLTDPPYGVNFQSNRRIASAQSPKVLGDESPDAAIDLLDSMLRAAQPILMDACHLLVFTGWRYEPDFRAVIERNGFEVCASLVWVKENHTSGDLSGFAPKHERIIHARRGSIGIFPRKPDVLTVSREHHSDHPTEKPLELLKALIDCTTTPNERVLDPFAGSGSTVVAARELGRIGIGIELNPEWYAVGMERIHA